MTLHNGLIIENLDVSIDLHKILHDVSIDVKPGTITTLLGPSGCGKSTLLKAIVGLLSTDKGDVSLNTKSLISTPAHKRGIGLMFQNNALFPHKNVERNVAFGLQMQGKRPEEYEEKVTEMLDLVGLSGFNKREIGTLSGGESQRVALARALAPSPKVLLLDEPFNSLDRSLRTVLLDEVRDVLKTLDIVGIHVTHDWDEATRIADNIAFMNQGQIIRTGSIEEIIEKPKYSIVADLIGLESCWTPELFESGGITYFDTPWGRRELDTPNSESIAALIRPENIYEKPDGIDVEIQTKVSVYGEWIYKCRLETGFIVSVKTMKNYSIGEKISLYASVENVETLEVL
ncbi:MAG: iron ABC transporter ATP-binding protein [Acidimicrobiaceae bacterium]|nr:iron ABC transporter ATP-binding protein [Acidimicrobiaceae bacterium]